MVRIFYLDRIFYGVDGKVENQFLSILEFCFHYVTLEADPGRLACGVDMVDSALKRLDVALCKRGTFALSILDLHAV